MTTSNSTQQNLILEALREHGSLTTLAIREHLGIMHPAGRINTLRATGHTIDTSIICEPDSSGVMHKQACYSLRKEASHD